MIESIVEILRIVGPIVLAGGGVALRLEAYLRNGVLSLDEAALARNIIERPWTNLLGWLDYSQVAPSGFLLVEKAMVSAFGTSEYALRLFPLLCALASIWLCWSLCRRIFSPLPALIPFGLFALNTSVIEYGMRAKPYAGDVAAALLVSLVAVTVFARRPRPRRAMRVALGASLTVLFSFPSIFVLAGAALAAANKARRETEGREGFLAAAAIWMLAAGGGALLATISLSPADAVYMRWFWKPAFIPFTPTPMRDFMWVGHQLQATVRWTLNYRASALWIVAAAAGAWSLVRRRQGDAALLLLLPLVLAVAASAAQRYPFTSGRTQLFLIPALLLLAGEGADWSRRALTARATWIAAVPSLLLVALAVQGSLNAWQIQRNGDLRMVFQYVRNHWHPGDRVYVHFTAAQLFMYYEPRLGFTRDEYVLGTCDDDDRLMLRQVDGLRNRPRVWVAVCCTDETEPVLEYLRAAGTIRETFNAGGQRPGDSSLINGAAILYDLTASDSRSVTPTTFPLTEPRNRPDDISPCYGVFGALPDRKADSR